MSDFRFTYFDPDCIGTIVERRDALQRRSNGHEFVAVGIDDERDVTMRFVIWDSVGDDRVIQFCFTDTVAGLTRGHMKMISFVVKRAMQLIRIIDAASARRGGLFRF